LALEGTLLEVNDGIAARISRFGLKRASSRSSTWRVPAKLG